jgi:hypothetical protein
MPSTDQCGGTGQIKTEKHARAGTRMNYTCQHKGFAQKLFLLTALCIHRQLCQCYAGGGGNGGSRSTSRSRSMNASQSSFSSLSSSFAVKNTGKNLNLNKLLQQDESHSNAIANVPQLRIRGGRRSFNLDSQLQASIATTIDDEEGKGGPNTGGEDVVKRLSIRGGNTSGGDIVDDASSSTLDSGLDHQQSQMETIIPPANTENGFDQTASTTTTVTTTTTSTSTSISTTPENLNSNMISNEIDIESTAGDIQATQPDEKASTLSSSTKRKKWPCGDALDKQLVKIALPCIANFAINPLVGASIYFGLIAWAILWLLLDKLLRIRFLVHLFG